MKTSHFIKVIAGISSIIVANTAIAAETRPYQLGNFQAWSTLDLALERDDNPFRLAVDEQSSTVLNIAPNIRLTNSTASRDITLNYNADIVEFFDFDDDSYISHNLDADILVKASRYSQFGFSAHFIDGNETRGTGSSEGDVNISDGATEFTDFGADLSYYYGSDDSPLSAEISLSAGDIGFDNFRELTAQRDRTYTQFSTLFDYEYSVATSVFLDLSYRDTDFDFANGTGIELDNNEVTAQVGFAWAATRSTTGRVGFGVTSKDATDANEDRTFTSWDVAIDWEPTRSDVVNFSTDRSANESTGFGLFVISSTTSVNWSHDISAKWAFSVNGSFRNSNFAEQIREDDTISYGLSGLYRFNRYMNLSFGYEFEDKDSNVDLFDYERNVIDLTLSLGL